MDFLSVKHTFVEHLLPFFLNSCLVWVSNIYFIDVPITSKHFQTDQAAPTCCQFHENLHRQSGHSEEERLLVKAQQAPYNMYIRIHQRDPLPDQQHADWVKGLDADVVVAADGAASLTRRAFPDAFVNAVAAGVNIDAQQIRLGETADGFDEADYALGIALKPEFRPPQKQALNVILTLAQNVYLLNSQEGSRGFLNIRITKEEYEAVFSATGNRGCAFGSPIRLFREEDLHVITESYLRLSSLRCAIQSCRTFQVCSFVLL